MNYPDDVRRPFDPGGDVPTPETPAATSPAAPMRSQRVPAITHRPRTPFVASPWPEFSWSESKARLLRRCPAAYRLATYTKWNGWSADASPEARAAYICSKLTSLPLVLGQAVHRLAEDRVFALLRRRRLRSERELRDSLRADLNAAYQTSKHQRQAFLAYPSRITMLAEVFWREGISPGLVADLQRKAAACAESLVQSSVFELLADLTEGHLLTVDTRTGFLMDGVPVYGAPDLVFWIPGPGSGASRRTYHIVDWKTGTADGVIDQVSTYAYLIAGAWSLDLSEVHLRGAVVPLGESGHAESCPLTVEDIVDTAGRIQRDVAHMRTYCADPNTNEPLPPEAFPTRVGPHCRSCAYRGLCPEAQQAGFASRALNFT